MKVERQIELRDRRIVVDGQPRVLVSGEVHYFRTPRAQWADRLHALSEAGCSTVATYMPWIWHELPDGSYDLDGRTRPERDLAGFVDLAEECGLFVLARPGPFVMAELKNEGLPHRLYDQHPAIHPVSWDGARVPSRTVDYLDPDYLAACRDWYRAVNAVLVPRLLPHGGPVLGYQLDNEVGMLAWVTNAPDLTDGVLADLTSWLRRRYDAPTLAVRYPFDLDTEDRDKTFRAFVAFRSPREEYATALRRDLGYFMRDRFARYVGTLRAFAEEDGVTGVPFLVNLHGTDAGRGRDFPLAISQLAAGYAERPGITSGSDHYLGDLTVANTADLYLANACMAAVHDADQPLTSLEFEAGTGDYDEDLSRLIPPEAVELKTRLCVAQGIRLVNYYLFAGGHNPLLDTPVGDGNDRIAFTGERHGFAAPVGPEGQRTAAYTSVARAVETVTGAEKLLAGMDEEHDGFAYGFVPDHFMTEYHYPGSPAMSALVHDLERFRGCGARDILARALLFAGFSFGARDIQHRALDPAEVPALVLSSPPQLDDAVQQRLLTYVSDGGQLLLAGVLPTLDLEGRPCTLLADGLGVEVLGRTEDRHPSYYPSVRVEQPAWGSAFGPGVAEAEVRVGYAQLLRGPASSTRLATEVGSGEACVLRVEAGRGGLTLLGCDYPCHLDVYRAVLGTLGVRPRLTHDATTSGIVLTSTADDRGQRLVHVLNVSPYPATFGLQSNGAQLLGGKRVSLPARAGLMLPRDVHLDGGTLVHTTAELAALDGTSLTLRTTQPDEDVAVLDTVCAVTADSTGDADGSVHVTRDGRRVQVRMQGGPPGALVRLTLSASGANGT